MNSIDDIIPLLVDMRYDLMSDWDHISLIHDNRLGLNSSLSLLINSIVSHWSEH